MLKGKKRQECETNPLIIPDQLITHLALQGALQRNPIKPKSHLCCKGCYRDSLRGISSQFWAPLSFGTRWRATISLIWQSIKSSLFNADNLHCCHSILKSSTSEYMGCLSSCVFIGPRCPWGPIYGSWSLSVRHTLNWCDSGWWG